MKKRIWSLLLAAMLLLSVCGGALADDTGDNTAAGFQLFVDSRAATPQTIKVNGLETGTGKTPTVIAYRIMDIGWDDTTSTPTAYTWITDLQTFAASKGYGNTKDLDGISKEAAKAFYEELGATLKASANHLGAETVEFNVSGSTATSKTNATIGQYLIIIEGGRDIYSPCIANVAPVHGENGWTIQPGEATAKSETVTLDKKINKDDVTDGHNPDDYDTAFIGEVVTFDITARIPPFPANATAMQYDISDTMSEGLTYAGTPNPIKIYGTSDDAGTVHVRELESGEDFTFNPAPSTTSQSFTIEFDYEKIEEFKGIHIQYQATLNEKAKLGTTESSKPNTNEVTLTYSNDPYDASHSNFITDEVKVYTYGIRIAKVDGENNPITEDTAVFELRDGDENAENVKTYTFTLDNGVYKLSNAEPNETNVKLTTDKDGKIAIDGLKDGTYYLYETKAPGDYNLMSKPVEFKIEIDTRTNHAWSVEGLEVAYVAKDVVNNKGPELPSTGGMGTTLFTIVGIALMAAVVVILVVMSRKKSKQAE